jgi:hypothetical protein
VARKRRLSASSARVGLIESSDKRKVSQQQQNNPSEGDQQRAPCHCSAGARHLEAADRIIVDHTSPISFSARGFETDEQLVALGEHDALTHAIEQRSADLELADVLRTRSAARVKFRRSASTVKQQRYKAPCRPYNDLSCQ